MTDDVTPDDALRSRVRELRAARRSPKQIAKALGVRPAVVIPLVRDLAKEDDAARPADAVAGCWISPGWSRALTVEGHEDWPDVPVGEDGPEGIASVLVARRHAPREVSVCGYLVDVYCLGVKNTQGPQIMKDRALPDFVSHFFSVFQQVAPPLAVPLELARHLVYGAVDYARSLGFEPTPEFDAAAAHLGPCEETSAITFGRDGVPHYVAGPYDNFPRVLRTLNKTVGAGNFDFVAPLTDRESVPISGSEDSVDR